MTVGVPKEGPSWDYVEKWAEDYISKLRKLNDKKNNDIVETQFIRGQIKSLKSLLDIREA